MAALSEFELDLVFIRAADGQDPSEFHDSVEAELAPLFAPYGKWSVTVKEEPGVQIAVTEMRGIAPWSCEDEALDYIEGKAGDRFREWLTGYRLAVEPKEDAGSCRCKH